MNLPPITNKQQALLQLLYRFRFLERRQIQNFLEHKDKRRISAWLKDLREKQYIGWIFDPQNRATANKPAVYYLGLHAIQLLREANAYPPDALRKRYRDASRSETFISRCLLVADCCLNMEARSRDPAAGVTYAYSTEADYSDSGNAYHFLAESELVRPHVCYTKTTRRDEGNATTVNLLEVFEPSVPRHAVRRRIKGYVTFLDSGDWEEDTGQDELPNVLLVFPSKYELIQSKRYVRKLLRDEYDDDIADNIHIRFTTADQVKLQGVTGKIWEEV